MQRHTFRNVAFATVSLAAGLLAVAPARAASNGLTSSQVRDQFVQCGYEVGNPGSPIAGQYLVIRDPGMADDPDDHRLAMVIVYPSEDAAQAAHQQAHQQAEARLGRAWPLSDNDGPQLLVGYGGSVWRANLAMIESSSRILDSLYAHDDQTDQTSIARPDLFELSFVPTYDQKYAVDADLVDCLEDIAPVAIGAPPKNEAAPVLAAGYPW